jgi:pimeloyl-ACP methyl ester carboxylesterase
MVTAPDGARLFVTERGAGEPVLFVPGLGYGTWSWARQVETVSSVATALVMDNRGAGRSDKPAGPYSIDQLAEDAHAVLAHRSALPAHIVGSSMGGYIALTLALRHPEAVRSLTLIATTSGGPGSQGVPDRTRAAWANAAHLPPAGFARATMPLSFAPGWVEEHPAEFEELLALRLSAPTPAAAWRAQFAACAAFLRAGLPAGVLPQRSTVVHGTADRVVPYVNAAHLAERLNGAPVVTLQDAGHLCWIERAQRRQRHHHANGHGSMT